VEGDLLRLEFFHQLYASGADNRADDFVGGIADGHSHTAFELGMQQALIVFRHGVFGKQFLIVGKTDVRLARDGPEVKAALALFLGVFRVGGEMRRMVRAQEKGVAHEHQIALGGLHRVGDVALGLGLFHHSDRYIAPATR
jgi:hypothetical protein